MAQSASRDAEIWQALRAARVRPDSTNPVTSVGSLLKARDAFLEQLRVDGVSYEVREHEPVRHSRHLAATWDRALGATVRATLFDADGDRILVAVPADRKIEAPRLREVLGVARLAVLRADRGVGRLGWVNLPGDPGALPGLPGPFGARLIADPEFFVLADVVLSLGPTTSVRVDPRSYVATVGGIAVNCVGRTRLLPEGALSIARRVGAYRLRMGVCCPCERD